MTFLRPLPLCIAVLTIVACTPGSPGNNDAGNLVFSAECTGDVATFFNLAKGTYSGAAATFDSVSFSNQPASVAGFTNGTTYSVTVRENCTVLAQSIELTYLDGSFATFPGTGADSGKFQYDVDLTGTGVVSPHLERFVNDKRGLSLFDPTHTDQGVRIDE